MIPMTLAEIATAIGGQLADADPGAVVRGPVEFDSRLVSDGGLFFAFPGENVDGHDYAAAAVAAGAVAVVATKPVAAPAIMVRDAGEAMAALATAVHSRLPGLRVIAVTGSSGKTSTKDVLAQLLGELGPTIAPAGTYNNELGVPHTVLKADTTTRFLVLEMGSRGPGHISALCQIVRPEVGVVVNAGVAHIGEFGSVEAIAAAKAELVAALPSASVGGVAVLNADDERVRAMATATPARVVLAGEAPDAAVRATGVSLDERGRPSFTLVAAGAEAPVPVTLALSGRHQVTNTLLAAAVAYLAGLPLPELAAALGRCQPRSSRRMDVFDRSDGVTVIDDSYNANPASTAAALRALVAIGQGRRRIAVLGYHAELGDQERAGHEEVGSLAARLGVELVVAVGPDASPIHDGAVSVAGWGGESVQVTDQEAAVALLETRLKPGDVVLVKGSRYRTWRVADALRTGDGSGTVAP